MTDRVWPFKANFFDDITQSYKDDRIGPYPEPLIDWQVRNNFAGGSHPVGPVLEQVLRDLVPQPMYLDPGPKKKLPDIFRAGGGHIVGERMRAVIERIEPDVHQFWPLTIERLRGGPVHQPYYLFLPGNRLDAIYVRPGSANILHEPDSDIGYRYSIPSVSVSNPIFCRSRIKRAHIWATDKIGSEYYCSNEMFQALRKARVSNFNTWESDEGNPPYEVIDEPYDLDAMLAPVIAGRREGLAKRLAAGTMSEEAAKHARLAYER